MTELNRVNEKIRKIVIDLNQAGNYFQREDHTNFLANLNAAKKNLDFLVKDFS